MDHDKPESAMVTRRLQPEHESAPAAALAATVALTAVTEPDPRLALTHPNDPDEPPSTLLIIGPADGDLADPAPSPQTALRPGVTFGDYQLIRQLGRGGMGAVYLARDLRLGRRVAVKFLAHTSTSMAERFRAEARATARCRHDNIIDIYDVGQQHGHSYMVLEYIQGITLRAWIQARWQADALAHATPPLAETESAAKRVTPVSHTLAAEIMLPVVRALAHAHGQGLVHRDLKPENIMLTDDGRVKVLDFGIAKALEEKLEASQTVDQAANAWSLGLDTGQGGLIGTMPYMSPEQWPGEDLDGRSDIWAVGIMLWELCTARHPLAPLTADRLMAFASSPEPMPSLAEERPTLQPLADIVDSCLQKSRSDRMPSAQALIDALERVVAHAVTQLDAAGEPESPYVSLAAFQPIDAARFFGRARDIARLMGQLRSHRMVTVAGASGAGKSSLVRAGVIPALQRSGQRWEHVIVRPGRQPMSALASVLAQLDPETSPSNTTSGNALADKLRAEPGYLGSQLRAHSQCTSVRVLLFVDQFEELYTLDHHQDVRAAFVACLQGVADDASSPLRVILSMRSDFFDRVAEDRAFASELTEALTFLAPMQRAELRQALTRPLQPTGYRFESDALIDTMLDDLEAARTPLPLLQFTAARLWESRDRERKLITQASHDELGGIAGALASHADTVLAGLSAADQKRARTVFTALVSDERTRAIVDLDELRARARGGQSDAMEECVRHLSRARLLLIESDGEGNAAVELVHESLIDRWPTLRRWLDESAEDAEVLARLRSAARTWDKRGQAEGMLWAGEVASEARAWHTRYPGQLPERETAFLQAVFTASERAARRRRQLRLATLLTLTVVAVAATIAALMIQQEQRATEASRDEAEVSRDEARASKDKARAEALKARQAVRVAGAKGLVKRAPDIALQLLREVGDVDPSGDKLDWYGTVQASASQSPSFARDWLEGHEAEVNTAAFSPDGMRAVTASDDKTARVWTFEPKTGSWQGAALEGHEDAVKSAAFSPDGTRVVTASADRTARVWSLGLDDTWTGQALEGHEDGIRSAAFSPDGTRVVTASWDRTARVWTEGPNDTWTAQPLKGHVGGVRSAVFSADGARIVTSASWDATARVWTQGQDGLWSGRSLAGHEGQVTAAAFSLDGTRVVTASSDKTARVWNTDGTDQPAILEGHRGVVHAAVFSLDGTRVVTGSKDRTARVWKQGEDGSWTAQPLEGHAGPVRSVGLSADGAQVITVSTDKTARVWTQRGDGQWSSRSLEGHEDQVNTAVFSPDGERVLSASRDSKARVWVLSRDELMSRMWRDVPECLPVEKRRALLGESAEAARVNHATCEACVSHFKNPNAVSACPWRADADLLAEGAEKPPRPVPRTSPIAATSARAPTAEVVVPATVSIPGGTFRMGSEKTESGRYDREGPAHEVTVSPFRMCETEVTQAQWASVMAENAEPSVCVYGCSEHHPVHAVSWFEVIEYLNRLSTSQGLEACYEQDGGDVRWKSGGCDGYRLPTEAEWEYAARAGTTTAYSFGDDVSELKDHGWYAENAGNKVHPVGSKQRNPWGLVNIHGNVWEWTWDWYGAYSAGSQTDPRGQESGIGRVVRGGSFDNAPRHVRSAFRDWYGPMNRRGGLGFRCALGRSPLR